MIKVSQSLDAAIESWCGLKPDQFGIHEPLSNLWTRSGRPGTYDSQGIRYLLDCIYRRKVFRECDWALDMTTGMFKAGGGIQNYTNLFVHLENCDSGGLHGSIL